VSDEESLKSILAEHVSSEAGKAAILQAVEKIKYAVHSDSIRVFPSQVLPVGKKGKKKALQPSSVDAVVSEPGPSPIAVGGRIFGSNDLDGRKAVKDLRSTSAKLAALKALVVPPISELTNPARIWVGQQYAPSMACLNDCCGGDEVVFAEKHGMNYGLTTVKKTCPNHK